MQIRALGDFSVSYRISGYYPEVKQLLTVRSRLRKEVLNKLHGANIEIVSPAFMNQRQFQNGEKFIAPPKLSEEGGSAELAPESLIFDKADHAEKIHNLEDEMQSLIANIKALKEQQASAKEAETSALKNDIHQSEARLVSLENIIRKAKETPNE